MTILYTQTQARRLKELGVDPVELGASFTGSAERDCTFQKKVKTYSQKEQHRLRAFHKNGARPRLVRLENKLSKLLVVNGFIQVITPIIMSRGLLAKMNINVDHSLYSQIFWLNIKQCLRPMLAPHLYYIVKDLLRFMEKPVRLFEVRPCFRKESQGKAHSNEFTMLNLSEFGLPPEQRHNRIYELAKMVMEAAGIEAYGFESAHSEVYGDTMDVISKTDGLELGSSAMGPHPLDDNWRITDTWVGIGFGLERLIMATETNTSIRKLGRSITYLEGIRLNI